ncbi:hypothetical protein [Arthrobacter sp. B1805]|uniref:hypothetical protein n=1 Tax=Arthrobacter sp. B1805 TaxID=2058892 RepID=UPI000CE55E05|nr:hypothetical protein [Arthrobacter sp. B1805]
MTKQDTRGHDQRRSGTGRKGPDDAAKAPAASAGLWLRLFLLALLAGVLASTLMLPWKVLGLVLSLVALGTGVVALVKAISAKLPRFVVLATSLGLAAALFLTAGTGASVLLWPVTQTYEDCMSRALTLQAQSECEEGLRKLEGFRTGN